MGLALALYQPDIAQNTGTLLRFGACLDLPVHVIHPTGFPFSRTALKRSGMDYLDYVNLIEHDSYEQFNLWRKSEKRRIALLTTHGSTSVYEIDFDQSDILLMGRESSGVPEHVTQEADLKLRIPMKPGLRSLNIAIAASLVVGEAKRQTGQFADLT